MGSSNRGKRRSAILTSWLVVWIAAPPPRCAAAATAPRGPAAAEGSRADATARGPIDAESQARLSWLRDHGRRPTPAFVADPGHADAARQHALSQQRHLLMLRAATFDPLLQIEPDFGAAVPQETRPRAGSDGAYFVVKLRGPVTRPARQALEALGARVIQYVPHDAYVVRMDPGRTARLADHAEVRWHGRFLPGYRVSPALLRQAVGLAPLEAPSEPVRLYVTLFPQEDARAVAQELVSAGHRIVEAAPDVDEGLLVVEVAPGQLLRAVQDLASLEPVSWIERAPVYLLNNNHSIWVGQAYDTANGPGEATTQEFPISGTIWKRDILGTGQVVAVSDSGLDRDMCFYRDPAACPIATQSVAAPGAVTLSPTQRKLLAYNVLPGAAAGDAAGSSYHGTHTTGSVAGDNTANTSTSTTAGHNAGDGIAPQAKIFFEDIGDAAGALPGIPARTQDLWAQERTAGAYVSSNSWGIGCAAPPCGDYRIDSKQTDQFVWQNPDFLVLYSAGNSGAASGDGTETHPDKNVITVGGTSNGAALSRSNDLYGSSSRGPTYDGRIKPDMNAPAVSVVSASGDSDPPTCGTPDCVTKTLSGTSMACPTLAGFAALVRQFYVDGWSPTGSLVPANGFTPSAALLKATLVNGAMNMTGTGVSGDAPNFNQGWGRVHLDNALYFDDTFGTDARKTRIWDVPLAQGLATGEVDSYALRVNTGQTLKVTLVWTDPAAATYAAQALVDDLDLEVVGPTGTLYRGNVFTDGAGTNDKFSTANPTERDALNNVEGVLLATGLSTGTYTIRVRGTNVPGAGTISTVPDDPTLMRQPYALVVTGGLDLTAGAVQFASRSYPCGSSSLTVQVFDTSGTSPTVTVANSATGDTQAVTLTGTAPQFSGTLPLEFNVPAVAADGKLQVGDGSTVTATYVDAFTATATASIGSCAPAIEIRTATFSGGCDGDKYLDANETADLTVTVRNQTVTTLPNLQATVTCATAGVVIGSDTISFGTVAPGALASNAVPGKVSALSVAAGTAATFTLTFTADGFSRGTALPFPTYLEQDVASLTNASRLFDIDAGTGSDISPPCSVDRTTRWTTFTSATGTPTDDPAIVSTCDPFSGARSLAMSGTAYASCGTIPSACANYPDESTLVAQSPWILTAPTGSTFVSATPKQVRFRVKANMPTGAAVTDYFIAGLLDKDFRAAYIDTSYIDKTSPFNNNTWQLHTDDLSLNDIDAVVDRSQLAIQLFQDTRDAGGTTTGVVKIDDVELVYDAEGRIADASACGLPCAAPPAPVGLAASNVSGAVHLDWSRVATAGEYHLYRGTAGCGGGKQKIAEIPGTYVGWNDTTAVLGTTYAYELRSADATGACTSAASNCAAITASSGTCEAAPTFAGATSATSGTAAACGITVSWAAGSSGCPGGLTYNVHRSTASGFTPGPGNLVATGVAGTSYPDGQVASLTRYSYVVRAVDALGNTDGNTVQVSALASAPATTVTFADDAEVVGTSQLAVPWARSANQNHNGGGTYSYRTGVAVTHGNNLCGAVTSPELTLRPAGVSTLSFWTRYNVEYQWDGMVVEVATAAGGFANWTVVGSGAFYPSNFSQTNQCGFSDFCPGFSYCNSCCYGPTQACFNGPSGNAALTAWSNPSVDISSYNGQTIKFRFNFSSDPGAAFEGIYVDEIRLTNVAQPAACTSGACVNGPTFYGLVSAVDLDPQANTGVQLSWASPSAWGSGTPGSILVYRNGALLTTLGSGATTYTDTTGTDGEAYVYQVVAVNSCGTRDGNTTTRTASDCTVSDAAVDASVLLLVKSGGLARLTWSTVSGAGIHRAHWITTPVTASCGAGSVWNGSVADVPVPTLLFDHAVLTDGLDYSYKVGATSGPACAEEKGASCP